VALDKEAPIYITVEKQFLMGKAQEGTKKMKVGIEQQVNDSVNRQTLLFKRQCRVNQ